MALPGNTSLVFPGSAKWYKEEKEGGEKGSMAVGPKGFLKRGLEERDRRNDKSSNDKDKLLKERGRGTDGAEALPVMQ